MVRNYPDGFGRLLAFAVFFVAYLFYCRDYGCKNVRFVNRFFALKDTQSTLQPHARVHVFLL